MAGRISPILSLFSPLNSLAPSSLPFSLSLFLPPFSHSLYPSLYFLPPLHFFLPFSPNLKLPLPCQSPFSPSLSHYPFYAPSSLFFSPVLSNISKIHVTLNLREYRSNQFCFKIYNIILAFVTKCPVS